MAFFVISTHNKYHSQLSSRAGEYYDTYMWLPHAHPQKCAPLREWWTYVSWQSWYIEHVFTNLYIARCPSRAAFSRKYINIVKIGLPTCNGTAVVYSARFPYPNLININHKLHTCTYLQSAKCKVTQKISFSNTLQAQPLVVCRTNAQLKKRKRSSNTPTRLWTKSKIEYRQCHSPLLTSD